MTIAETREAEPESAKRRQILDGARRVFLADGFDGASMSDIARVAGVSKGTLYVYFESKESLFEALIRDDRRSQVERFVYPATDADPRETLRAFGCQLLAMMTTPEHLAQVRIVIAATAKFPNLGRAFYESGPCYGEKRLAGLMEVWRAHGVLAFDDARVAARHFLDLCKSGVYLGCLFGVTETVSPDLIAETVDRGVVAFLRIYGASAASMSPLSEAGASVGA